MSHSFQHDDRGSWQSYGLDQTRRAITNVLSNDYPTVRANAITTRMALMTVTGWKVSFTDKDTGKEFVVSVQTEAYYVMNALCELCVFTPLPKHAKRALRHLNSDDNIISVYSARELEKVFRALLKIFFHPSDEEEEDNNDEEEDDDDCAEKQGSDDEEDTIPNEEAEEK